MSKKAISILVVLTFLSIFVVKAAEAGDKQCYQWQGAAIALGAVALGDAIAAGIYAYPPGVVYATPPTDYWHSPRPGYVPGHWEAVREWVPGAWVRVWVPGHYNPYGNWIAGHYVSRQAPGRYMERRVWVEGYYRYN